MKAPSKLAVVEGGDHSLMVAKTALKALGSSQEEVDDRLLTAIARFLTGIAKLYSRGARAGLAAAGRALTLVYPSSTKMFPMQQP